MDGREQKGRGGAACVSAAGSAADIVPESVSRGWLFMACASGSLVVPSFSPGWSARSSGDAETGCARMAAAQNLYGHNFFSCLKHRRGFRQTGALATRSAGQAI